VNAADALRNFVAAQLSDWRIQFGAWQDGSKTDRYAVIKPTGGLPAELLRRPAFSLYFIGAENEAASVAYEAANTVIEAMRQSSGDLVFMEPSEPAFNPTNDGRPVYEVAVTTITN
jgi:hypothetical protein